MTMKKFISIITAGFILSSCVDTVLLPDDKTEHEDFWKTKADVELMVNGAYQTMCNEALMLSLFVWGDYRSDELVNVETVNDGARTDALMEISTANVQTTNMFADWASLYSVINNCNVVLENAEQVISLDPSYTRGEYETHCSQMLALRSLCYFYLVRNFRDVPYTPGAFMNSSQDMNLPQTAPSVVLQNCINDLEKAERTALDPTAFVGWKKIGWINKDGVRSILADIYLWRAAVNKAQGNEQQSIADYQKCVEYCNLVIESKKAQAVYDPSQGAAKEYPLVDGYYAFNALFIQNVSFVGMNFPEEKIFEVQFGSSNANTGMGKALCRWKDGAKTGYFYASSIFGANPGSVYEKTGDYRYLQNVYAPYAATGSYMVRKGVETSSWFIDNPVGNQNQPAMMPWGGNGSGVKVGTYLQNYVMYRLTDIMLMKAEAMTELAVDDKDITLREAFNLVQYVNARSLSSGNIKNDSLRWAHYKDKTRMETLVLAERLRELCFEGKRWYDLLRYNYRHVEGVDYTTTLAQQNEEGRAFVKNYDNMMTLMTRKNGASSFAVKAKMPTEPYLYMPVLQSQVELNPNLKQNPVYSSNETTDKNY